MALPATDSFTAANGTQLEVYNSNWSINLGALDINSNSVCPDSADAESWGRWNADTFDDDQYAQAVVASTDASNEIGPACRVGASGSNGYGLNFTSNNLVLAKWVAGAFTELASAFSAPSVSDVIRVEAEGTTVRYVLNTVTQDEVTDSSLSSGVGGIVSWSDGTGNRMDDWEAGNLNAGASSLSINVNDSVTVSESVTVRLKPILLSVNDSVTVSESIKMNLLLMPNISDSVTVAESVTMNVKLMPSVSDDVTVAEAVVMNVILMPNVNDDVTVAESVTVSITSIGLIPINVFDSVTVAEAVTASIPYLPISVSDDVTIVESISVVEIGGTKRRNLLTMKAGL